MKKIIEYFLLFAILLLISCDDTITSEDIDKLVMPDSDVSYAQHIAPVFEIKCVGCHNDQRKEGGVNLSAYTNVIADPRIVFPGEADNSVLVWTIEGLAGVQPMPPYGPLTQNHVNGIKTWINEGAKYN
jgi:mono/diheme cytochrome c family protein